MAKLLPLPDSPFVFTINGKQFHRTNYFKDLAVDFFRFVAGEKFAQPTSRMFLFAKAPMTYAEYLAYLEDWKGIKLNGLLELWEGEPKGVPLMSAEVPRQWNV